MENLIPSDFQMNISFDKESSTYLGIAIGVSIIVGIVIGGLIHKATN
jgi:hypothetical protein